MLRVDSLDSSGSELESPACDGHARWHRAVALSHQKPDPWAARGIHKLGMEHCRRHRYNAATGTWVVDDVIVKMEPRPFAAGAMRECYAMKKLSTFSSAIYRDWRRAPNFVAKRYKKEGTGPGVYYADVQLQMDAKLLGDEYNRLEPPKKVDFLQAALIELQERPGCPTYCIEHLIEGDYIKYNNNSGYVAAAASGGSGNFEVLRNTPQAFSHFTFQYTQGRALCVDIQGVADLYTDPQIHTLDGKQYGDGNLGLRGFALFLRSHECNPLCRSLGLAPFERCASDVHAQGYSSSSSTLGGGATLTRSFVAAGSAAREQLLRLRQRALQAPALEPVRDVLLSLKAVPSEAPPAAYVHYELSRLYAEVVLLPELRPEEDPGQACPGGMFHLLRSASLGCPIGLCILARAHCGLTPSQPQLAHLIAAAMDAGEFEPHPALAWRYAVLAAERHVAAAAAAVAHAYAIGGGVGEGVLTQREPAQAVAWLRAALAAGAARAASGGSIRLERAATAASVATAGGGGTVGGTGSGGTSGGSDGGGAPDGSLGSGTALERLSRVQVPAAFAVLAEEEAQALPGGGLQRHELLAELGQLLVQGGPGLEPDPAGAAAAYNEAAEAAEAAFKGKLALRYYEAAAMAESG